MSELDKNALQLAVGQRLACPAWPECGDDEGPCLACAQAAAIIAALEDRGRLLVLLAASRALIKRGPHSAAWAPFFDAVAALEGREG